jgi:hypothetical protein
VEIIMGNIEDILMVLDLLVELFDTGEFAETDCCG